MTRLRNQKSSDFTIMTFACFTNFKMSRKNKAHCIRIEKSANTRLIFC